uniref:Uncharacterized protein n=1 Tax=Homalodisca liturata TaxID=320908 RepID=A0A1B6HQ74_9HEMI
MHYKQNMRYWADTNPRELHQRPLHSPKVTVWCAISSAGIIGPWFFEENEVTVTVTSDRYVNMLQNFFFPTARRFGFGGHLVPTRRCNSTHFESIDGCFEGKLSRAPYLN